MNDDDRNSVSDYLASGKGCFPYEIVTGFDSLSLITPDGEFWPGEAFYPRLKDENISVKEWENCENLYKIMRMRKLSDFNDFHNVQDVIILGVILENRYQKLKRQLVSILDVSLQQVHLVVL